MIRFIDEYRDRFSVEFICTTLKDNRVGGFITSRGYRQSKARGPSARRLRDAALVDRIVGLPGNRGHVVEVPNGEAAISFLLVVRPMWFSKSTRLTIPSAECRRRRL